MTPRAVSLIGIAAMLVGVYGAACSLRESPSSSPFGVLARRVGLVDPTLVPWVPAHRGCGCSPAPPPEVRAKQEFLARLDASEAASDL